MALLGDLVVRIVGDTADFVRQVDHSGQRLNQFERDLKKITTTMTNLGKNMTRYVTLPIMGMAAGMVKAAADMELQEAAFETMLGSADKAKKLLGDLRDMAAKTPFQLSDLADSTKTMLAFGLETEKVLPYLGQLGDISMGNKDKLSSLTLAFSQIQSTGRLMGQDLLQLINAGFNPLEVISSKTGETMAELKKRMSAGAISAEEVAEAFKIATSEGGRFFGGMERASQTLSGQFSTLKDDVVTMAISFGNLLLPIIKDLVSSVSSFIKRLNEMDEGTKRVILVIGGIVAAIGPALLALAGIIKAVQNIGIAIKALSLLMNASIAGTPVGLILAAVALLATAAILIIQNWDTISAFFVDLWDKVVAIFQNAIEAIRGFLAEHWDKIAIILGGPLGLAVVAIIKHWDDIKAAFQKALDFIRNIVDRIKEELTQRMATITEPVKKVAEGVKNAFGWLKDQLVGKSIVPDMVDGILGEWGRLEIGTMEAFQRMASRVSNDLLNLVGYLSTIWDNYYATLLENEALTDDERKRLMREQAKANKTFALFRVAIDTASAIIRFLADPGGIPGIILSAAAAVSGIIQAAVIAAQPLPALAEGGVTPALLHPNEAIIPLDDERALSRIADAIEGARAAPGGGGDQMFRVTVNLGSKTLYDDITKATRDRRILIDAGAVA